MQRLLLEGMTNGETVVLVAYHGQSSINMIKLVYKNGEFVPVEIAEGRTFDEADFKPLQTKDQPLVSRVLEHPEAKFWIREGKLIRGKGILV